MKKKLTKDQESKVSEYLDKWLKLGHRTEPVSYEKVVEEVNWLYHFIEVEVPKKIVLLSSPLKCQLFINKFLGKKECDSQLDYQLDSQLYSKLDSQLNYQFDSQLNYQLRSQLYSQLNSQLRSQRYPQLDSQLDSQLYPQLDSQLNYQLDSRLDSQLRSQLRSKAIEYCYDHNSNWNNNYYKNYDFILNEIFPEKINEFIDFKRYLEHIKNIHKIWIYKNIAIVCQFPTKILLNQKNELHSLTSKALEYKDSYGIYAINGEVGNNLLELLVDKTLET